MFKLQLLRNWIHHTLSHSDCLKRKHSFLFTSAHGETKCSNYNCFATSTTTFLSTQTAWKQNIHLCLHLPVSRQNVWTTIASKLTPVHSFPLRLPKYKTFTLVYVCRVMARWNVETTIASQLSASHSFSVRLPKENIHSRLSLPMGRRNV